MTNIYYYVGPQGIAARVRESNAGFPIRSVKDVLRWIRDTDQNLSRSGEVTATFVVDEIGSLRIADRRSEHFACAGGGPVRSAGEMTFGVCDDSVSIAEVTNQSIGYCPEPESWHEVQAVLLRAGFRSPSEFTAAFHFRRCENCRSINIVKDGVFECAVCSRQLPDRWNLRAQDH